MTDGAVDLCADLRDRLVKMRERVIEALAHSPQIEPSWLHLLVGIDASLRALGGGRRPPVKNRRA